MPALPAWARAATRSLLSLPQPSSARMSTATVSSCSDSSALSGRPGVPLTPGPGRYGSRGHGGAQLELPQRGHRRLSTFFDDSTFRKGTGSPTPSGARGALHVNLQARPVVGQPALAAGVLDHPVPLPRPVVSTGLRLRGGPQRGDVEEPGLGVLQPAEPRTPQRAVG